MANVLGALFGDIADAIREKTGDTATMKPAEFPVKISGIDVSAVLQDKTITENGTYTADSGFDGLGSVLVNVASAGGTVFAKKIEFQASSYSATVTHNLGAIPKVVVLRTSTGLATDSSTHKAMAVALGLSSEAANAMGLIEDRQYCLQWNNSASVYSQATPDDPIDTTNTSGVCMCKATETTITFGSSSYKLVSGLYYIAYLIGSKTE